MISHALRLVAITIGMFLGVVVLHGQSPDSGIATEDHDFASDTVASDTVGQLVRELDSRSFVARKNAMKKLIQVGSAATNALVQGCAYSSDEELKSRSRTIMTRWLAAKDRDSDGDDNDGGSKEIEKMLTKLAQSKDQRVAATANDFLKLVEQKYRQILETLKELGATVVVSDSDDGTISRVHLEIDENWTGSRTDLLNVASMRALQSVVIRGNDIEDGIIDTLKNFSNLKQLALQGMDLSEFDLRSLSDLADLQSLDLSNSLVGDECAEAIGELTRLNSISLQDTLVTDHVIPKFASLPNLRELSLARTQITSEGFAQLSQMHQLEALDVRTSRFNKQALYALRGLEGLRTMKVSSSSVHSREREDFQYMFPDSKFHIEISK